MRIRLKKGVALFGAIAGAAIATALIIYNVNQTNSVNVSDMENSGLLGELGEGIEDVLSFKPNPTVVAEADSGDTAASAGVLGTELGEEDQSSVEAGDHKTEAHSDEDTSVNSERKEDSDNSNGTEAESTESENNAEDGAVSGLISSESAKEPVDEEIKTYVDAVPQTRTETVVDEVVVTVEKPVTVVEEVTEEVEKDPVYFYSQTDAAATGELQSERREQEAMAAKQADIERLEAAAKRADGYTDENDWFVPDQDNIGDCVIVFY